MTGKKLLKIPFFGDRVEVYGKINSTQERVRQIHDTAPVEALVVAESQEKGFGRRGSRWESPSGGLYFSMLFKSPPEANFSISALIAVLKALLKQNIEVNIKWPNDVYSAGKKLAGIISERFSDNWSATGVGINAGIDLNELTERVREKAAACEIDKKLFLKDFISYFSNLKDVKVFPAAETELLNKYNFLKEKTVVSEDIHGKVEAIDSRGRLLVRTDKETVPVEYGSVSILEKQAVLPEDTIVCVDAGNTFVKIGKLKKGRFEDVKDIPTQPYKDIASRVFEVINNMLDGENPEGIALSCVVRPAEPELVKTLKEKFNCEIININSGSKGDVELKVDNPQQAGADRICNAAAAMNIFGCDTVVIDLGTANTFDIVTENGEYLGGIIAPGTDSMADALADRADRLSLVKFNRPAFVIGKDTESSMTSGLYFTLKGQIQSVVEHIRREWKKDFKIVFTGGSSEKINPDIMPGIIDKEFTLKGLAYLFFKIRSEKKAENLQR